MPSRLYVITGSSVIVAASLVAGCSSGDSTAGAGAGDHGPGGEGGHSSSAVVGPVTSTGATTTTLTGATTTTTTHASSGTGGSCVPDGDSGTSASSCCSSRLDDFGYCCSGKSCCDATNHSYGDADGQCTCEDGLEWQTDAADDFRCVAPACVDEGEACSADADCCGSLGCYSGSCGQCDPSSDYPVYCAASGGSEAGCWSAGTACDTVTTCTDGTLHACDDAALTYDCAADTCSCADPSHPVYCDDSSGSASACWTPGVQCSSVITCSDGAEHACTTSGATYDCSTNKCTTPIPTWLVGYFSNPGNEGNTSATGAANLNLSATGSYSYTACYGCTPSSGTWTVVGNTLSFTGGILGGDTYDLTTALTPNCRIIRVDGKQMWRSSHVPECPFTVAPLTASECAIAGKYTRHESMGSSSSTYTYDYEIDLDTDRFYYYREVADKTLCSSSSCGFFHTGYTPEVGTWTGQSPKSTAGYSFSHASSCP